MSTLADLGTMTPPAVKQVAPANITITGSNVTVNVTTPQPSTVESVLSYLKPAATPVLIAAGGLAAAYLGGNS